MPMKFKDLPDRALLRRLFFYDAGTGEFTRLPWGKIRTDRQGRVAGTKASSNSISISVNGEHYQAHRLAWVYENGPIPPGMEVDHIDNDPSNNMISNLRLASSSEQKMNKRIQSNSRSGLKGAYYHACHKGKKWRSQIKAGGALHFLGYYHTAEEAHEAYKHAAAKHFGEFARF